MKFSMAVSFLIAFSLGRRWPEGPDEGRICRSGPFAGGSGKAAPHQSAGKPLTASPAGEAHLPIKSATAHLTSNLPNTSAFSSAVG